MMMMSVADANNRCKLHLILFLCGVMLLPCCGGWLLLLLPLLLPLLLLMLLLPVLLQPVQRLFWSQRHVMLPKKSEGKKWRNYSISEVTRCICRCCPCCCPCCWPCCSWIIYIYIYIWLASVWWRFGYFINYILFQGSWRWCWTAVCRSPIACSDRSAATYSQDSRINIIVRDSIV